MIVRLKKPLGPSIEEFLAFAEEFSFDRSLARSVWRYYRYRVWKFPNGDPITRDHWLTLLEKFEREAANRPFTPADHGAPHPNRSPRVRKASGSDDEGAHK